jgi:hypothetical protein
MPTPERGIDLVWSIQDDIHSVFKTGIVSSRFCHFATQIWHMDRFCRTPWVHLARASPSHSPGVAVGTITGNLVYFCKSARGGNSPKHSPSWDGRGFQRMVMQDMCTNICSCTGKCGRNDSSDSRSVCAVEAVRLDVGFVHSHSCLTGKRYSSTRMCCPMTKPILQIQGLHTSATA